MRNDAVSRQLTPWQFMPVVTSLMLTMWKHLSLNGKSA
jgi:hypothetical protein